MTDKPQVCVILTVFRRRQNLLAQIAAIASQSIKADLIIVDNSGYCEHIHQTHKLIPGIAGIDVWKFDRNAGPPCRFAPAFMMHDYRYFMWIDDDVLPGPRCVEHYLAAAHWLDDRFATIGDKGRIFRGREYIRRNINRVGEPRRVDISTSGFFAKARDVHAILLFKWLLIDRFGDEARHLVSIHDDFLICQGIQHFTGFASYLPHEDSPETMMRMKYLDDGGGGVSARPEYMSERNRMIEMMHEVGWQSMVK